MENGQFEDVEHSAEGLEEIIKTAVLTDRIVLEASEGSEGFGLMLHKAREAYFEALWGFTNLDLYAAGAIRQAQGFQADMKRYTDLIKWLGEQAMAGKLAKDEIDRARKDRVDREHESANFEELKNFYGSEPGT